MCAVGEYVTHLYVAPSQRVGLGIKPRNYTLLYPVYTQLYPFYT